MLVFDSQDSFVNYEKKFPLIIPSVQKCQYMIWIVVSRSKSRKMKHTDGTASITFSNGKPESPTP